MWIDYIYDTRYRQYCVLYCLEHGTGIGDIELCRDLNISEDIFNNEISSKSYVIKKEYPYPNSNYIVTYFVFADEIKQFIEFLESCRVQKMLRG